MSAPIPVWHCGVKGGVMTMESRELFAGWVKRLKDGAYTLTLKKLSRQKSNQQLGYLFGVLYPVIAESLGYRAYEVEEVHDACMRHLRGLKPEPNPLHLRESLRDHDHAYTSEYITDLRHWALMDFQIVTPDAEKAEPTTQRRTEAV